MSKELFNQTLIESPSEPDNDHRLAFGKPGQVGSNNMLWSYFKTLVQSIVTTIGDYISFTPLEIKPDYLKGRLFYDNDRDALSYYNSEEHITVNLGLEHLIQVKNETGLTIPNGALVYPLGVDATQKYILIGLADARYKEKCRLIGMATHSIEHNTIGYVTRLGEVSDIDTSAFTDGGILYLSDSIPGAFTDIKPLDGGYVIAIGAVKKVGITDGSIVMDPSINELTVEVTDTNGFPPAQRTNTTLAINQATRTFSIAPNSTDFHFYEIGDKYDKHAIDSIVYPDSEGEHWFYYNSGVLSTLYNPTAAQKRDIILNKCFICAIYWDATNKKIIVDIEDERHGISMSPNTHLYLHLTRGAQWIEGFGIGNISADQSGDSNVHAQFSVEAGIYFDEDLSHNGAALAVGSTIPVVYNSGANRYLRESSQTGYAILNAPAGRLYYNQNNAGTWQLAEVTNNNFVLYHIFGFNGIAKNVVSVMGQAQYATVSAARAGAQAEISNIVAQLPFPEMIPLGTIIYATSTSYTNAVKARIVSTDTGAPYVDWRTTELAQGAAPTSHANLTNLEAAGSGVTWGHINSIAQTIYGDKTFNGSVAASNLSGTNTGDETTQRIGNLINSATEKTAPIDADYIGLMDSAAGNILKKLSWANIKATLKTYFDTLYGVKNPSIVAITTNTTLDASHDGKIIHASNTITITFPNGMATGMRFDILNIGIGVITLAASTTLNSKDSNKKLASRYGGASVYHSGSNVWYAVGDLTA